MTNGPQNINGVVVGLVKEIDEHNASIKVRSPATGRRSPR